MSRPHRITGMRVIVGTLALAGVSITHAQVAEIWGEPTNGVRLGLKVLLKDSWGRYQMPECIVLVHNVTSNRVLLRLAPEIPSNIRLLCPDGQEAKLRRGALSTIDRRRRPMVREAGETAVLKWFFITNLFDLRTNGLYTLIISERATTNNIRSREPTYFLFPPVTNTFDIPVLNSGK